MKQDGGQQPPEIEHRLKHQGRKVEGKESKTHKVKSQSALVEKDLEFFYALLRHDLGNDLQIVLGNIEVIEMLMGGDHGEANRRLASMSAAAKRMVNLLNSLEGTSDFVEGDVIEMLENAADVSQDVHSRMTINLSVSDEVRTSSLPSYRLLGIAYENLFRNAVEHCGEDVVLDISVKVNAGNIAIEFIDDGPGIPQHLRPRIFQRGVSSNGGGLGLYITHQLLEFYNGTIELLASSNGQGARFLITLPIAP